MFMESCSFLEFWSFKVIAFIGVLKKLRRLTSELLLVYPKKLRARDVNF